ncbi:MAG: LPS export ABC transporter periplasmic protein LptC [Pseudomonadota bacterium]|nr:LPS export ABC transporter periplasmic protein LptC [Pseudomonadota bacterium]
MITRTEPVLAEPSRRWSADPRTARVGQIQARRNPLVGFIKAALVGLSVLLLATLLLWPQFVERRNGLPLDFAEVDVSAPTSTMTRARFVSGGQPSLNVTADKVVQDADSPELVHMENLAGDTTLADGQWLHLSAATGAYDRVGETLELNGDVALFSDSGNELHSAVASFEFRSGRITGGGPVTGHGPFGRIKADSFEITDDGKTMNFTGNVRLVIEQGGTR